MTQKREHSLEIPADQAGQRLDRALARLFPQFSRTRLKHWIEDGSVRVDGMGASPRTRVLGGEQVVLTERVEAHSDDQPEAIPLAVVFDDKHLIVVDKPVGLVVHPGAGNRSGTLVNALLNYDPGLDALPRAGLVHRIDKGTSGLLIVGRTAQAHKVLVEMLAARLFKRDYQAVCRGVMTSGGMFDEPIARHSADRKKMAARAGGRSAVTHYRVIERFRAHTHVSARLETGRTHQIRVHFSHHGYPLVGDPVYGGRLALPAGASDSLASLIRGFGHQALHAWRLGLEHPVTGEAMSWTSEPPADFDALVAAMRVDCDEYDG